MLTNEFKMNYDNLLYNINMYKIVKISNKVVMESTSDVE